MSVGVRGRARGVRARASFAHTHTHTHPHKLTCSERAAASTWASVWVGRPVRRCSSDSLGHTYATALSSSSEMGLRGGTPPHHRRVRPRAPLDAHRGERHDGNGMTARSTVLVKHRTSARELNKEVCEGCGQVETRARKPTFSSAFFAPSRALKQGTWASMFYDDRNTYRSSPPMS